MKKTQTSNLKVGLQPKYRSNLEEKNADSLIKRSVRFFYEHFRIPYVQKKKYKPDFLLNNAIIIEIKGHFKGNDRGKHRDIKKQHPDLDIRFVFARPHNRLSKTSKTTYAKWAETHGFKWAEETIPQEWIDEPMNERSRAALRKLGVKL